MTELARRTINELLARYELEPELNDIFVEGKFDQEVFSNYFRGSKQLNRMVYEIDSVEVPAEFLLKHGLTEGNKQRVIALSRELAKLPPESLCHCLVDRDLDHWFGPLESTDRLTWTEFCSIELHFFSDEILHDVLITTAKAKIIDWEKYTKSLIEALRNLYALRLADRELDWSLEWLPIDKYLSHQNSQIDLDLKNYIARLLQKNGKVKASKQFINSISVWQGKLSGDPRNYIRGHDFVELLAWTVNKFRGLKEFSKSLTIERLFVLLAPKVPGLVSALK